MATTTKTSSSSSTWRGLDLAKDLFERCSCRDVEMLAECAAEAQRLASEGMPWAADTDMQEVTVPKRPGPVGWQSVICDAVADVNATFARSAGDEFQILGQEHDLEVAVFLLDAIRERLARLTSDWVRRTNGARKAAGEQSLSASERNRFLLRAAGEIAAALIDARDGVVIAVKRNGTNEQRRDLYARVVRGERVQHVAQERRYKQCNGRHELPAVPHDDLRKIKVGSDNAAVVRDGDLEIIVRYRGDEAEVSALTHLDPNGEPPDYDDEDVRQCLARYEDAVEKWPPLQRRVCARRRVGAIVQDLTTITLEEFFGFVGPEGLC